MNIRCDLWESILTIRRIFVASEPFRFFMSIGAILFSAGFLIGPRRLSLHRTADSTGRVRSLILASIPLGVGFQTIPAAFLADLLVVNRRLVEDIQRRIRSMENRTDKSAP